MMSQRSQFGTEKPFFYLPAVLRPTRPPGRQENHRELSHLVSPIESDESFWKVGSPYSSKTGHETGFGFSSDFALSLESLGKVTGSPTRVHWKPDMFSTHCDFPSDLCTRAFTTFRRRHHCRRCGLIFCHQHSLYSVPLDQDANFHPYGTLSRTCESCWIQWTKWIERRLSASLAKESESQSFYSVESDMLPIDSGHSSDNSLQLDQTSLSGCIEMSQSVSKDWNWSTF